MQYYAARLASFFTLAIVGICLVGIVILVIKRRKKQIIALSLDQWFIIIVMHIAGFYVVLHLILPAYQRFEVLLSLMLLFVFELLILDGLNS